MFSPLGKIAMGSSHFPPLSPKPQSPALTMQSPVLRQSKKQQKIISGDSSSSPTDNDSSKSLIDRVIEITTNKDRAVKETGNRKKNSLRSKSPPKGTKEHLERFKGKVEKDHVPSSSVKIDSKTPIAWAENGQFPDYGLKNKLELAERDQNIARLKLIKTGVNVIDKLPLDYLFSKPETKLFAIEKAFRRLIKPALASFLIIKKEYFDRWRYAPPSELNDKQV